MEKVLGTIKRVISNPEELGNQGKMSKPNSAADNMAEEEAAAAADIASSGIATAPGTDENNNVMKQTAETTPRTDTNNGPMVIEFDRNENDNRKRDEEGDDVDRPLSIVKPSSNVSNADSDLTDFDRDGSITNLFGGNTSARYKAASLYEEAVRQKQIMMAKQQHQLQQQQGGGSGSVGSSQSYAPTAGVNSSRDASGNWGWFEDVHGAGGSSPDLLQAVDGGKKESVSPKPPKPPFSKAIAAAAAAGGGQSLDPFVPSVSMMDHNEEAAIGAVTAPPYVLEESLSSQRLWKDTAGNRPPQPYEERAFYEKMWAQNFVKSQVDYTSPIEILTASSPDYLSPFADANFDSSTNDHHAHVHSNNYDVIVQPPARDTGGNTKATDATLAEATLIHRLQDPRSTDGHHAGRGVVAPYSRAHGRHDPGVVGKTVKGTESEGDLTVLIRGDNVFGTTVSKSFAKTNEKGGTDGVDTVNISVASYRVVESKKYGKYAQFLVIYREGSIRDTVGVWKRYSDFVELSRKVTETHEGCTSILANMSPLAVTEEHEQEHLPNAITSWKLLKKRQRWYRCLDAGYLSLKVFLLERFLHDILFESSSPKLLRDFALNPERLVSSKPVC